MIADGTAQTTERPGDDLGLRQLGNVKQHLVYLVQDPHELGVKTFGEASFHRGELPSKALSCAVIISGG
jgi:hypothetical protein